MRKPVLYLSGPMANCDDQQINGWRNVVIECLSDKFEMRNPKLIAERDVTAVVEGDKQDIDESHAIIANCWKPSHGTSMEIHHAWVNGKYIVSVVPSVDDASAWVVYHSNAVFSSLDKAIAHLHGWAERRKSC